MRYPKKIDMNYYSDSTDNIYGLSPNYKLVSFIAFDKIRDNNLENELNFKKHSDPKGIFTVFKLHDWEYYKFELDKNEFRKVDN